MPGDTRNWSGFAKDVARTRKVWSIRDAGGFPAPMGPSGRRSMPFWSSAARAKRLIAAASEFTGFQPVEISWEEFRDKWLVRLEKEGWLVGVNWSGARAIGFDLEPNVVKARVESEISGKVVR